MINLTSLPQTLQSKQHYHSSDTALTYKPVSKELDHLDCVLYRISSVTYHKDTDAPQMQALENVLSSLRIPGINIIYLMLGDKNGVEFYYGVARDYMSDRELKLSIKDIAREILAPSIKGNFRGSKLIELDREQKEQLLQKIQHSTASSVIEGVPGVIEEENFQGADRLADTMINIDSVQDSSFGFMVIASCVNYKEVDSIKTQIYEIYRAIACFAKESVQIGSSDGTSQSEGTSNSTQTGTSHTTGTQKGSSQASTREIVNKYFANWQEYIDEILLPRLDYASGKGLFASGIFCFSNSPVVLHKLQNTVISLFSGQKGNKIPLRAFLLESTSTARKAYTNLQLPHLQAPEQNALVPLSSQSSDKLANWLSTKELGLLLGLPKKDVIGLELREEVEFGLNFTPFDKQITLGHLIQSGNTTSKQVGIDREALDRHIFITGVTGSGKTTTTQTLLLKSTLPFLVIEPAKTEYRILRRNFGDELLVFTLGKDNALPFRLNPFEFFPHESITSRIDMIRASIEAAFDMEAAIPQLIEQAIYKSYADKGWNIASNENAFFDDPWADGVYAFPTLSDVLANIEAVVEAQGFGDEAGRLKGEYIGSIKARLGSLAIGSKGFMLDTKRSLDFVKLLSKKVVLEMEEIRNGTEKSLVMGLVLGHLLEAIKARFKHSPSKEAQHIIVIEEAHRLLSKFQPGDNPSKKQAVESFADMLAEVRKYGECLIIADQIPNKLTPEVLKNTNTKIVHKLFAQDDKQAVSSTIALEEEQMEFLSRLEKGVAAVFSSGFHKAVLVEITPHSNTSQAIVDESELEPSVYGLYADSYQRGIVLGSQFLSKPSWEDIKQLLRLQRKLIYALGAWCKKRVEYSPKLQADLQESRKYFDDELIARILLLANDFAKDERELEQKLEKARKLLQGYGVREIEEAWDLALAIR